MYKRIIVSLTLVLLLLLLATPLLAGSRSFTGTVDTTDAAITTICGTDYQEIFQFAVTVSGTYSIPTLTPALKGINDFYYVIINTIPTPSSTGEIFARNNLNFNTSGTLNAGTAYYMHVGGNNFCQGTVYPVNYNFTISGPGDICLPTCGVAIIEVEEEDPSPRQIFFDGRINSYDTGNSVVLFGKPDEDDAWRLEVYNADASGMLFVVYPDAIAAVAECPESNTLIQSDAATGISLWRLTERTMTAEGVRVCPFQLNAPASEAGKTYVIIFDTLFPNSYYESGDEWIGN